MSKINRLQSFRYAFEGLWHTLRTQRNAQIHVGIGLMVVGLGLFLGLSLTEWAIIALTVGFVIVAETFNTALEAAMDYVTSEIHPQVKIVKDAAAGAVLLSAITALIVGLLILGPPLYQFILTWLTA